MGKAGQSILMLGKGASYRALTLLREHRAELSVRYPDRYLVRGEKLLNQDLEALQRVACDENFILSVDGKPLISAKEKTTISAYVECDESGVFGGLWKLGEMADCGLCVTMSQIPVLQFSIELCDLYDESLFEVDSKGTVLMLVSNGKALIDKFADYGLEAYEIGYVTANNDRIVKSGENTRFINKVRY